MSGFENKIIKQIINKLGYEDEPGLLEKSTELVRLLDLKSSKVVSSIGDYGKTVICVDLAATQLGIFIDMDIALKLSGLRKTAYINNKRNIEKLLDLSEPIGIKEICTKLNINECQTKAIELLNLFKIKMENYCNTNDIDLTHPQYSAMAIYQASKLLNKKIQKTKIQKFSHLKLLQWNKLEQQWNKIIEMTNNDQIVKQNNTDDIGNDRKNLNTENDTKEMISSNENSNGKEENDNVEDYEIWKRRMLIFAEFEIRNALNRN